MPSCWSVCGALGLLWASDYEILAVGFPLLIAIAYLVFFDRELTLLRRVTWVLFGVGLALTLLVEVVVLKGDVGRSNMVFRFYDQAWFIFGLAIGLGLIDLLVSFRHWPGRVKAIWAIMLGLLVLSAASYPLIATDKKMTDRWPEIQNPPHTLDGAAFMLGDTQFRFWPSTMTQTGLWTSAPITRPFNTCRTTSPDLR